MKKISLLIILLLLIGCQNKEKLTPLHVIGDLKTEFDMTEFYDGHESEFESIDYKSDKLTAIDAMIFYDSLDKVYEDNIIYFVSEDGFMNAIDDKSIEHTFIGYSKSNGWVYHSDKHPPNSGIRQIAEIIIVKSSDEINYEYGLSIIDGNKDTTLHYSIGQLHLLPYRILPYLDGVSKKVTDGKTYEVKGMKQKRVLSLNDLVSEDYDLALLMTGEGDHEYLLNDGYIEIGQTLNYIIPESYDIYNDLKGIMINPPQTSVMDLYDDVIMHLDQPVMVIFIDGFSNHQYDYMKNHMKTYLNTFTHEKATSVFKPVTNAGFAAMLTGQTPKDNGVLDRSFRTLLSDDIFSYVTDKGLTSKLIEGNVKILDTSIDPVLNLDHNNNGITDDEIFTSAKASLDSDFLLVHFHSLDEFGHDYGPLDERTLNQLLLLDTYVKDLSESWSGYLLVVTDHGMHKTEDGGNHGEFRAEDILIPYLRRNDE